jgi:PAS domain S-box-containing protein
MDLVNNTVNTMNDMTHDDPHSPSSPIPFRHIMALLTEGVAVLAMGRVIYANAALCEMSGKNRGELIGCSFLDLTVDSDRPLVAEYLRHLEVSSPDTISFQLQRATSAGRQIHLKAAALQLHGIYANAPGICCCLSDVTHFQDQISNCNATTGACAVTWMTAKACLMAFAPYDSHDILLVNRYVEALLGCSMKDILSGKRHLFDFVHPDHLSQVIDFYKGFPDIHESAEIEYRVITDNRKTRWVRDMGNTLFVERGRGMPRRVDHTLVDITDQKIKELELQEERRKLSSIIKNSTEMIYRVDRAGNFLDLNPAGMKLIGASDDWHQRNIMDLYVDHRQRARLLAQLEEKDQAQQLVKWKVADGAVIDVVINAVTERHAQSDILTYQGIVHNVTRTLELQKVDTIKKMAGGLSDKINTPLMTLSISIEMMRDTLKTDATDTAALLQYLDEMEKAYRKIVGPMAVVRDKHWDIEEVSDGAGGTIYEINEKKE